MGVDEMNNPLRMEYLQLLLWRQSGRENGDLKTIICSNVKAIIMEHGYGSNQRGCAYRYILVEISVL